MHPYLHNGIADQCEKRALWMLEVVVRLVEAVSVTVQSRHKITLESTTNNLVPQRRYELSPVE